jgi:20S proteasome subunit beta 6
MPIKSIARLIQTMLYARRMFPYYVYNVLAGIEEDDGTGAVYSFDPVGSYERETCRAAGAAQSLLQPFLDNQVRFFRSGFLLDRRVVTEAAILLCGPLADLLP